MISFCSSDNTGEIRIPNDIREYPCAWVYLGWLPPRLPVVVALVNFDPQRARVAAESFAQLAETNQVLVFTCHPSTAEMFADAAGAQVVDISG